MRKETDGETSAICIHVHTVGRSALTGKGSFQKSVSSSRSKDDSSARMLLAVGPGDGGGGVGSRADWSVREI